MHLTVWRILWSIMMFIYLVQSTSGVRPRSRGNDGRHKRVRKNLETDISETVMIPEGNPEILFCYERKPSRPIKKITWYRNGIDITDDLPEAYEWSKTGNTTINIRKISSAEHNAVFSCRMTFLNGDVWRNTTVLIDNESRNHIIETWEFNDTNIDYTEGGRGLVAPYFLMADTGAERKMLMRKILQPVSSLLRLFCPARGNPAPEISWTKNGKPLEDFSKDSDNSVYREHTTLMDDGIYVCTAKNQAGLATVKYNVRFDHNAGGKPLIESDYPKNATVYLGQDAKMECKIHSGLHPTFTWVKFEEDNAHPFGVMHGDKYNLSDPSILVIKNASFEDQGEYSCIVENAAGPTWKNATLSVIDYPPPPMIPIHPITSLTTKNLITICVCIIGGFALLSALVFFISRRFACGRPNKGSSSPLPQLDYRRHIRLYRMIPSASEQSDEFLLPRLVKAEENWVPANSGSIATSRATTISDCQSNTMPEYELPFDEEWEISRKELDFGAETVLGEGAFGKVVKAYRQMGEEFDSQTVAVKMSKDDANEDEFLIFAQELEVMKNIGTHPYVIQFYGCCTLGGPLYMVMEYAPFGNLRDFLKKQQPLVDYELPLGMPQLTNRDLESYCQQIAHGMKYLHSRKFIHRDLAARNILVVSQTSVKISDFGLSRDTFDSDYYRKLTNGKLPVKWMAPESLAESKFTQQSDVWSFGVLMWEIMSFGDLPYMGLNDPERLISFLQSNRLKQPLNCSEEIYNLMQHCWQWMPSDRPNFNQITNIFDGFGIQDYPDLSYSNKMLMQENQEYFDKRPFNTSV